MNLKKRTKEKKRKNRKGSYLIEAAFVLPVLIVAILALSMIVNIIAVCETVGFALSSEVKAICLNGQNFINRVSLCSKTEQAIESEHGELSDFRVTQIRDSFRRRTVYDLMSVTVQTGFTVNHTIGIHGNVTFTEKLMARPFSGALQDGVPLSESAFTQGAPAVDVIVYPKYGERFHIDSCSIVQQQKEDGNQGWAMDLEEARRQGFSACMVCGGGEI